MLLDTIEIKNYRSLEHITLTKLKHFNVLIGRNNAGKSSVFQALYDLVKAITGRETSPGILTARDSSRSFEVNLTFKLRKEEREYFVSLLVNAGFDEERRQSLLNSPFLRLVQFFFKSAPGNPQLMHLRETKITIEGGQWATVQKMVGQENTDNPQHKHVNIIKAIREAAARNEELKQDLYDVDSATHFETVQFSHSQLFSNVWKQDDAIKWLNTKLREYLSEAFFFNPFRHSTPMLQVNQTEELAPDGANLAQVLNTVLATDRDIFEAIEQFIHEALPDMGKMQTPLTNNQTNIVFRSFERTYSIPLTDMGGGIEQLLMVATVLLMPRTQQSTLFLEEPESHLHAGAQRYLIEHLYNSERQVFISTHSPTFINLVKPFSLYQITNTNGRTNIKYCDEKALDDVLEDIGVRNSDVLMSDGVLFVEGPGDRDVLTIFSETLNTSFAERNINILPMGGGRHAERGAPIRKNLLEKISRKAPVPHMFLLDRDERRDQEIQNLEAQLGKQLHIFAARELENYLLIPSAILDALIEKYHDDPTILAALNETTEEKIKQRIIDTANNLYDVVLLKHIRTEIGGLKDGLLPEILIPQLLPHVKDPNLAAIVLKEIKEQLETHISSIDVDAIVKKEREELDELWKNPSMRLKLAPGEEILTTVYSAFDAKYRKPSDTVRIARHMKSQDISDEIKEVIENVRKLANPRQ